MLSESFCSKNKNVFIARKTCRSGTESEKMVARSKDSITKKDTRLRIVFSRVWIVTEEQVVDQKKIQKTQRCFFGDHNVRVLFFL